MSQASSGGDDGDEFPVDAVALINYADTQGDVSVQSDIGNAMISIASPRNIIPCPIGSSVSVPLRVYIDLPAGAQPGHVYRILLPNDWIGEVSVIGPSIVWSQAVRGYYSVVYKDVGLASDTQSAFLTHVGLLYQSTDSYATRVQLVGEITLMPTFNAPMSAEYIGRTVNYTISANTVRYAVVEDVGQYYLPKTPANAIQSVGSQIIANQNAQTDRVVANDNRLQQQAQQREDSAQQAAQSDVSSAIQGADDTLSGPLNMMAAVEHLGDELVDAFKSSDEYTFHFPGVKGPFMPDGSSVVIIDEQDVDLSYLRTHFGVLLDALGLVVLGLCGWKSLDFIYHVLQEILMDREVEQ